MDNWKDIVLSHNLDEVRPPAFMQYVGSGEQETEKSRSTVVQEHYEKVRSFLNAQGYSDLIKMIERLQTRRSEIKTQSSELVDSRIVYLRAQYTAFQRKHPEIEADLFPAETGDRRSSLDEPIGKAWLDEQGDIKSDGGWVIDTKDADASETSLARMEISLPPEAISGLPDADRPNMADFGKTRSRLNPEDLRPSDQLTFTGDTTWSEVIDTFEDRLRSFSGEKDRVGRTRELLGFRTEIARVVLSRFETLGEVPDMTSNEARESTEPTSGTTARGGAPSSRVMTWQENAASFYAYLQNHKQPESIREMEDETLISSRQAWKKLKEKGYGVGDGLDGLISALEEWAPEFEETYGKKRAVRAADPFQWPEHLER